LVTEILPPIVNVTEGLILIFPTVNAAAGDKLPVPVNTTILPGLKISAVVVVANPFLKFNVLPLTEVKTGATAPPKVSDGAEAPLKFIMPAPVTFMVPLLVPMATELLKLMVPEFKEITLIAVEVPPPQVTVPVRLNVPVVTSSFATLVAVALAPENTRLPLTMQVPAPISKRLVMLFPLGWFIVRLPVTVKTLPELSVKARPLEDA
jgi:hypothetical protein